MNDQVNHTPFLHRLATPYQSLQRERYVLSEATASKIDALAKLCLGEHAAVSKQAQEKVHALSIAASSTIEGEGLPKEMIEKIVSSGLYDLENEHLNRLCAMTEPGEHVNADLRQRLESYRDIKNAYVHLLHARVSYYEAISTNLICDTHRRMFERTRPDIAGAYKNKDIYIQWYKLDGQEEFVPTVPCEHVSEHMSALCDFVNLRMQDKPIGNIGVVAELFCDFLAIHPFMDGNGRLARILCGYLLKRTGYHLIELYQLDQVILETRDRYYKSLNNAQAYWRRDRENLTQWVDYFVDCLSEHSRRAIRAQELLSV